MTGKYEIVIHDSRVRYELVLERNITIIKGNSGTGKTTLYELVSDLKKQKQSFIKCNYEDRVMVLTEDNWKTETAKYNNRFLFADEGSSFVNTLEFAEYVKDSGNYFIIISRSGRLKWLAYSINSIFEIKGKKNGNIMLNRLYSRYAAHHSENIKPDITITEDSGSGRQMMKSLKENRTAEPNGCARIYTPLYSAPPIRSVSLCENNLCLPSRRFL